MKKIRKLQMRKGYGYIDVCIGLLALLMVVVLALNIFQFLAMKQHMEEIANQLIEIATYTGGFGDEFDLAVSEIEGEFDCHVTTGATRYFDAASGQVQLGDKMTVQITKTSSLRGLGAFEIPITAQVTKSGISEKYWK